MALVWDVAALAGVDREPVGGLTSGELEVFWAKLTSEDAADAYAAVWALAQAPKHAVPFLKERLGRVLELPAARLKQPAPPSEQARVIRAVESLEQAGTPEARRLVRDLARAAPEAWFLRPEFRAEEWKPAATEKKKDPILGTWGMALKAKDGPYIVVLTLGEEGKGQFYLFGPTNTKGTAGRLLAAGLRYKVQGKAKEGNLLLSECLCFPNKKAKMAYTLEKAKLRFKNGKALRSEKDKAGLDLKGAWSRLDTDQPFGGIVVGPGGSLEFGQMILK
jgi:hypothetical protein